MAVMGVRSSWLTVATNSRFMRSTALRSVMSCTVPTIRRGRPSPSLEISPCSTTTRSVPSGRRIRCSTPYPPPPSRARATAAMMRGRSAGCTASRKPS